MTAVGFNTIFPKIRDSKFIIKNTTNKTIKLFTQKIESGQTYDLMTISHISEADIKHSLLKGVLQKKIAQSEIIIEESNINLVQYDTSFIRFLQAGGLTTGVRDHGPDEMIITNLIDLPSPVNGIITLSEPNKIYYIRGSVELGENRIILTGENSHFLGRSPRNDGFTGNISGNPLIQAQTGIQLEGIYITNSGGEGIMIDGGGVGHVIMDTVGFLDCLTAGSFQNLTVLSMRTCMVKGCFDGITIDNVDHTNITEFSAARNKGTAVIITVPPNSSLHSFGIHESFFFPENGQTSLNISQSATLLDRGTISDSIFNGGGLGTPLAGITKKDSQWWFARNAGILDSRIVGAIGYSSGSPTLITIDAQNEWTAITGPFSLAADSERVSLVDGYNLSYDGYFDHQALLNAVVNVRSTSGSNFTQLAFAINGSIKTESVIEAEAKPAFETYVLQYFTLLSEGDTISIFIRNIENTFNYEVRTIRLNAT